MFFDDVQWGGGGLDDSTSSGDSLWIVTCGVVVIAASILVFGLGGPVFILATLLSLTENLTGTIGGGISWNLVVSLGKGCTTLGGVLSEALLELHGLPLSAPAAKCPCCISTGGVLQAGDRTHMH